jgi:hypothetical protein
MTWQAANLAAPEFATEPEPPAWCGLFYSGRRHLVSGPPEATKTLLAWVIALEVVRSAGVVAFIDFEMGGRATRRLLEDLGWTLDEIACVNYYEPDSAPTENDIAEIIAAGTELVVIDAAVGAYGVSGLDDEKRRDAEAWSQLWIAPLFAAGIATILVDHVTKNRETRGKFAIGSERKTGAVDVHLGLEDVATLTRGGSGLVKVRVHKDRPGHLRRPYVAELELRSDPITHAITWTLREPGGDAVAGAEFKPTVLMAKVSIFLRKQREPVSLRVIEDNVKGKSREWIRKAADALVNDGYAAEEPGARGARMLSFIKPYPTSPDLAAVRLGEETHDLAHLAHPLQGGEVRGEVDAELERLTSLGEDMGLVA